MSNLLDPDLELRELNIEELRVIAASNSGSVLRRGRAVMELGRRASSDTALLQEVADMIRTPENTQLMTVGSTSVSQLGVAGLVAGGGETALTLASELVGEWQHDAQSDFAWLMKSSGITWPLT